MIVIGSGTAEDFLTRYRGASGIDLAQSHYRAWRQVVSHAKWRNPEELKQSYPKATVLGDRSVAFRMNGNKYVLLCQVHFRAGILAIRFFGTDTDYERFERQG